MPWHINALRRLVIQAIDPAAIPALDKKLQEIASVFVRFWLEPADAFHMLVSYSKWLKYNTATSVVKKLDMLVISLGIAMKWNEDEHTYLIDVNTAEPVSKSSAREREYLATLGLYEPKKSIGVLATEIIAVLRKYCDKTDLTDLRLELLNENTLAYMSHEFITGFNALLTENAIEAIHNHSVVSSLVLDTADVFHDKDRTVADKLAWLEGKMAALDISHAADAISMDYLRIIFNILRSLVDTPTRTALAKKYALDKLILIKPSAHVIALYINLFAPDKVEENLTKDIIEGSSPSVNFVTVLASVSESHYLATLNYLSKHLNITSLLSNRDEFLTLYNAVSEERLLEFLALLKREKIIPIMRDIIATYLGQIHNPRKRIALLRILESYDRDSLKIELTTIDNLLNLKAKAQPSLIPNEDLGELTRLFVVAAPPNLTQKDLPLIIERSLPEHTKSVLTKISDALFKTMNLEIDLIKDLLLHHQTPIETAQMFIDKYGRERVSTEILKRFDARVKHYNTSKKWKEICVAARDADKMPHADLVANIQKFLKENNDSLNELDYAQYFTDLLGQPPVNLRIISDDILKLFKADLYPFTFLTRIHSDNFVSLLNTLTRICKPAKLKPNKKEFSIILRRNLPHLMFNHFVNALDNVQTGMLNRAALLTHAIPDNLNVVMRALDNSVMRSIRISNDDIAMIIKYTPIVTVNRFIERYGRERIDASFHDAFAARKDQAHYVRPSDNPHQIDPEISHLHLRLLADLKSTPSHQWETIILTYDLDDYPTLSTSNYAQILSSVLLKMKMNFSHLPDRLLAFFKADLEPNVFLCNTYPELFSSLLRTLERLCGKQRLKLPLEEFALVICEQHEAIANDYVELLDSDNIVNALKTSAGTIGEATYLPQLLMLVGYQQSLPPHRHHNAQIKFLRNIGIDTLNKLSAEIRIDILPIIRALYIHQYVKFIRLFDRLKPSPLANDNAYARLLSRAEPRDMRRILEVLGEERIKQLSLPDDELLAMSSEDLCSQLVALNQHIPDHVAETLGNVNLVIQIYTKLDNKDKMQFISLLTPEFIDNHLTHLVSLTPEELIPELINYLSHSVPECFNKLYACHKVMLLAPLYRANVLNTTLTTTTRNRLIKLWYGDSLNYLSQLPKHNQYLEILRIGYEQLRDDVTDASQLVRLLKSIEPDNAYTVLNHFGADKLSQLFPNKLTLIIFLSAFSDDANVVRFFDLLPITLVHNLIFERAQSAHDALLLIDREYKQHPHLYNCFLLAIDKICIEVVSQSPTSARFKLGFFKPQLPLDEELKARTALASTITANTKPSEDPNLQKYSNLLENRGINEIVKRYQPLR